ncbi:MAG: hypothetical protein ABIU18_00350 [Novosphingobium sp.]
MLSSVRSASSASAGFRQQLGRPLIAAALLLEPVGPSLLQSGQAFAENNVTSTASAGASTVCVSGAEKNGEAKGKQFVLPITSDKLDKYLGRGFVVADCKQAVLYSEAQRKRICDYAALGNRAINLQFLQRYGVTPADLCQERPGNSEN